MFSRDERTFANELAILRQEGGQNLPTWADPILQDFASVCANPNVFETFMLANVCRTHHSVITNWCKFQITNSKIISKSD